MGKSRVYVASQVKIHAYKGAAHIQLQSQETGREMTWRKSISTEDSSEMSHELTEDRDEDKPLKERGKEQTWGSHGSLRRTPPSPNPRYMRQNTWLLIRQQRLLGVCIKAEIGQEKLWQRSEKLLL